MKMIFTNNAPAAIGPYSQAVKCGSFIFLSGQLPINPKTNIIEEKDVQGQTKQIMENIKAILLEEGLSLNSIVKTTIFISDMKDFSKINDVYSSYLGDHRPARSTVEVSRIPKDSLVEIEVLASIDK